MKKTYSFLFFIFTVTGSGCGDGLFFHGAPIALESSLESYVFYTDQAITPILFPWENVDGNQISVAPALPSGLTLNTSTYSIEGTPTTETANTLFTVTLSNPAGTSSQSLNIRTILRILEPQVLFDINPGTADSNPDILGYMHATASGGAPQDKIFFAADDGTHGTELWATDGTVVGTQLILNAEPGSAGLSPIMRFKPSAYSFYPYQNTLQGQFLYLAGTLAHGLEIWRTDGTMDGTFLLKDIYSGANSGLYSYGLHFNGFFYFPSSDATYGNELWRTNGTTAGTTLVKDFRTGVADSGVNVIGVLGDQIFFGADDGSIGHEIYKSTVANPDPTLVSDLMSGAQSGILNSPHAIGIGFNSQFIFPGYWPSSGHELLTTNGTSAGTTLVKNIGPTSNDAFIDPGFFEFNGKIYFQANDGTNGVELWSTDGTSAGTSMVLDLNNGSSSSMPDTYPPSFTIFKGRMYFFAYHDTHGRELWSTDGTSAGTVMLKDLNPGAASSVTFELMTVVNDTLFFIADDGTHGHELWKTDGTSEGTVLVKDLNPGAGDGADFNIRPIVLAGVLYFVGTDGGATTGKEIYRVTP